MAVIYTITVLLLAVSVFADTRKTGRALRVALRRFLNVAPAFFCMLIAVAAVLYLVPDRAMVRVLARENKWIAVVSALGAGSVSIMPGFIAFPLCGILLERGALYMVLSAFSTTLMMVGVVTFPVETAFLGLRLTVWRNIVSFLVSIAVALATGFFFGELL